MNHTSFIAVFILSLGLSACASAYETAKNLDTAEGYRTFLRENPKDAHVPAARSRLSELEFLHARRQHTLPAYKRFLIAFPNAPRAKDARLLVEGIRFEMASAKDTAEAWLTFLRDHPQGVHAKEARKKLEDADYRALGPTATSKDIRTFLGRHPEADISRRRTLEKRLDELEFKESESAGAKALVAYLESNPSGIHHAAVKGEVLSREALALAATGDFQAARQKALRIVDDEVRKALGVKLDLLEVDDLTARLDLAGVDEFARRLESRHESENPSLALAKSRSAILAKEGKNLLTLKNAIDPLFFAHPPQEMIGVLKSDDPRDRWRAALELGETAGFEAVKPLLDEVANSKFSKVRTASFQALEKIFAALPADLIDLTLQSQISALEKKAVQDTALFVRIGVLQELSNAPDKALVAYENALRIAPDDTFALRRSTAINLNAFKTFRGGILARELAFRSRRQAEMWTGEVTEGINFLLVARTMCGLLDDASNALESLQKIPLNAASDLTADLPDFLAMAEDSVAFVKARLDDAEADARAKDPLFAKCGNESDLFDRLEEGVERRLKAVDEIAHRQDDLKQLLLNRLARRDPSPKVRLAAKVALEQESATQETTSTEANVPSANKISTSKTDDPAANTTDNGTKQNTIR